MSRECRVLLVDDHELVRAGFRLILETEPGLRVVGEAADGAAAVEETRRLRPDLALMDVQMPVLDGIAAARRLAELGEPARIVILTTFERDDLVVDALRAGASGFLLKNAPPEQLVEAVRTVAAGDALLAPSVTRRLIERFATTGLVPRRDDLLAPLTGREREVLTLVATGRSNAEIAASLHLGEATVKTHLSRTLQKLHLRDRVHAVVFAYEIGLVAPGTGALDDLTG
ncbi:response regulator [Egicoccus halophilus]|uniref:DNA-binding response regulator n=1 Tax=Egicoccus halophilus TaxID=1670830 RepID=A0A8J3A7X5_9ACTN|nr:response regulator transcription factor [Egicoccus halophilus]GGI03851.1 DNA-binding response regulator [Egicoccus halophilus]